ncbi:MAG TPA: hypothetical protein VGI23_13630 [Steroidobacteraceae bacterium]
MVTGSYADADNPNIVIVVMDMHDLDKAPRDKARRFAASVELATAREQAGAIGSPDGVWFGPHQFQDLQRDAILTLKPKSGKPSRVMYKSRHRVAC